MRFLLTIHGRQARNMTEAQIADSVRRHMALIDDLKAAGAMLAHGALAHSDTARTWRADADGKAVHDGPFAETREQLAGFYLIEAADMTAALAWAERLPILPGSGVEVRQVVHGE